MSTPPRTTFAPRSSGREYPRIPLRRPPNVVQSQHLRSTPISGRPACCRALCSVGPAKYSGQDLATSLRLLRPRRGKIQHDGAGLAAPRQFDLTALVRIAGESPEADTAVVHGALLS